MKFRHLLEEHGIGKLIFDNINKALDDAGFIMHRGTIVDANLITAQALPRTRKANEILKCPRPRRETRGISV